MFHVSWLPRCCYFIKQLQNVFKIVSNHRHTGLLSSTSTIVHMNCSFLSHVQIILHDPSATVERCCGIPCHLSFVQHSLQPFLKPASRDISRAIFLKFRFSIGRFIDRASKKLKNNPGKINNAQKCSNIQILEAKAYFPLGDFIRGTRSESKNSTTWLVKIG